MGGDPGADLGGDPGAEVGGLAGGGWLELQVWQANSILWTPRLQFSFACWGAFGERCTSTEVAPPQLGLEMGVISLALHA